MARIQWLPDPDSESEPTQGAPRAPDGEPGAAELARIKALRKDFMAHILSAGGLLTSDGALSQVQHEMIASYVAIVAHSPSCLIGHTEALEEQGEQFRQTARALRAGDLDRAGLTPSERCLLEFAAAVTERPYRVSDAQVQVLRDAGWTDSQLAEAVFVAALTNMMACIREFFGW